MGWKWKAVIIGGVVLLLAILVFIIKYQHDMLQKQRAIEQSMVEMKQLQDGVVRAQAKYVTKGDLKDFAGKDVDLKPIEKDLKKLGANIKGISKVLAKTPGYTGKNIASTDTSKRKDLPTETKTVPCPDGSLVECPSNDPFGYQTNAQRLRLDEPFSDKSRVPFGEVTFEAWKEKPWSVTIESREYSAVSVISVNEDGRHFVHNKLLVRVGDESYTVPIENSEFVEVYPDAKFSFNPRLYIGVDGGTYFNPVAGEVVPNLQLALFSYGKTKVTPDWTFLGVGLGYMTQMRNLGFVISPVNYNVAQHLPFAENMFIGPMLGIDLNGNVGLLGGLRVGL